MKKEVHIFFTALQFFTRIPGPKGITPDPQYLQKSSKYFSLIGWIVGSIGALVFYGAAFIFPKSIALILSMAATIYTTGAFHEDGFADVCDGLGGGWTKKKILLIMKDSRLGTYGVIGLSLVLATKYVALLEIETNHIPIVLFCGHSLSRFIATTLLFTHPYVRDDEDSKAKPAAKAMTLPMLLVSGLFGLLPLMIFQNSLIFLALIPVYLSKVFLGLKFKKWLGGQTGDCAGAVQQLSEVVFYLSSIILWNFI